MKNKILISTIIMIVLLFTIYTVSIATINPNDFKPNITSEDIPENAVTMVNRIVTTLTILGTTISIIMVVAVGFKYMVGSIEERAEYKKTMIPMLIGAFMIFGTSWMVKFIYNLVNRVGG